MYAGQVGSRKDKKMQRVESKQFGGVNRGKTIDEPKQAPLTQ